MRVDFIIVGQGVAGTLLAHFLRKAGQKVVVFDNDYERAASKVAAGIINPITGRRYVKSWRVDKLLPFAQQTYQQIEQELSVSFYQSIPIIRTLFNRKEEEAWLARTADPAYEHYILDKTKLGSYGQHTVPAFSYGEVGRTAQVDLATLTEAYRTLLQQNDALRTEVFDYQQLQWNEKGVHYQDVQAKGIVFCEGHQAKDNPFFGYLPFGGAKGEVLDVHIPEIDFEKILKHRVFIVPRQNGLYWIGSTYGWNFDDDAPTEKGRAYLQARLEDVLKVPFEIRGHRAAIRPTVKDRRPFLGLHPKHEQLAIFNGLGTKGASLGPFFARQMADFLLQKQELDEAVDIGRFL